MESERQEFRDQMTSEGRPDQTKLDRCHHGKKKGKKKFSSSETDIAYEKRGSLKNSLRKSPDLES